MWLTEQKEFSEESIIASAQFLYLISDTMVVIGNLEKDRRTTKMVEFINYYIPVLLDHYNRWIFDEKGIFQVRGWGCKQGGTYVPTGMNHYQFITKKINRELGDKFSPGYCNSVTDTDMWIFAGVCNLLASHKKDQHLFKIPETDFRKLNIYLRKGVELIKSRISHKQLRNFEGKMVIGANFDLGAWDDHPDFAYSGYYSDEFPGRSTKLNSYRKRGVGWDLSHARRFVNIFGTLVGNKNLLNYDFYGTDLLKELANQLVYGTFNRNEKKPLFTNFMDGTNGWYRVGYSGRKGFGHGPGDMSIAVLTGGYGFWTDYNRDLEIVMCEMIKMLYSTEDEIRRHVKDHYETYYWQNYRRVEHFSFNNADDPETNSFLICILPSLGKMACNDNQSVHFFNIQ